MLCVVRFVKSFLFLLQMIDYETTEINFGYQVLVLLFYDQFCLSQTPTLLSYSHNCCKGGIGAFVKKSRCTRLSPFLSFEFPSEACAPRIVLNCSLSILRVEKFYCSWPLRGLLGVD